MAGAHRPPRNPRLSQHFLHPPAARALARNLAARGALAPGDLVVEIGAGAGALTAALAGTGVDVCALEVDPALCARLRARFARRRGVRVRRADFLAVELPDAPYKVVANLPFRGSAAMVRRLAFDPRPPAQAWLVLQREAALRFTGRPRRAETLLSLELKPHWHVELLRPLGRAAFAPPPAVDCALLWLARRSPALLSAGEVPLWRDFVASALGRGAASVDAATSGLFGRRELARLASELGFEREAPPSALAFDQWLGLFRHFALAPRRGRRRRVGGARRRLARPTGR